MATPENKLPLKVMVDSKRNKVIFAEAGSEFVDVLFSILTLPLGTIIRRLNQHFGGKMNALGCLNNLYSSVENFSDSDVIDKEDRHMLLHPKNASHTKSLKLNVDDSDRYLGIGLFTNRNGSVFADSTKSFIITDDLRVMPSLDGLSFELLQHLASDVDEFEEKLIIVGLNEVMHLLKWSLLSSTPLTNLLLWKLNSQTIKDEPNFVAWAPREETAVRIEGTRKTVIKALVQKSTNMLLFFLVGVDFIDLLFKFLIIPLGSVLSLLGGNTTLGSIDNLYSSISKLSSLYLVSEKALLTNPKVVLHDTKTNLVKFLSFDGKPGIPGSQLLGLMFEKRLIKGSSKFMVTDDLIVTPLTSMSIILHLQSCKIPISDVKEMAFDIGTKEAIDILKTSLTSTTSVLSTALQLMKKAKHEK